MREVFRNQIWNLVSVISLITFIKIFIANNYAVMNGALWGISTRAWFWLAIAIPIFHQVYVWLIWRLELYQNTFTKRYGVARSFKIYAAGFSILFASRLIFIIILAKSSQYSLLINPYFAYLLAAVISLVVIYLFYSVIRYFTLARAYGIDHFDKDYNEPYVKKGIFRFTDNGMYVYGLMILYLPGLLFSSKAALIVALFNHIYIWVHYYCTERPDMKVIYGKTPSN
ncbi:MAG: phosphatidylethanolamine N-methyltransferase family protein [Victivallaceae bacterium]|nr:phosphatidylethanolamine N-methyltransferase family protein [Victivallaceae bacterium]